MRRVILTVITVIVLVVAALPAVALIAGPPSKFAQKDQSTSFAAQAEYPPKGKGPPEGKGKDCAHGNCSVGKGKNG